MGHSIDEYSLVPFKIGLTREELHGREIEAERNIVVDDFDLHSVEMLNEQQRAAFDDIIDSCNNSTGSAYFVDGPGGTGKTFLYKALLATVRSTGGVALAVASSGVAASLLPHGRTAHSRFKIPLNLDENMTCSVSKNTDLARLIISAKLILWDEASMANRKAVEAVNLLLQDLMENKLLFGGKTVVLGGDFRQTVPIVRHGTRNDTVDACLVNSRLWSSIKKIKLAQNMRAINDPEFTNFLLRVGGGEEPYIRSDFIALPANMCMPYNESEDPLSSLVSEIFPSLDQYSRDPLPFVNTAILTPKNGCMSEINAMIMEKFPGTMVEYISTDVAADPQQQSFYQDYMNDVKDAALPPHRLQLKINTPIMLLRNISPSNGQCNGTRMIVKDLGRHMIGAVISVGSHKGQYVMIPRIPLDFDDPSKTPIAFKRYQFPIRTCFAMSINKAQGQTLDRVGVYLPVHVFSHGQLYVAISRVRDSCSIKFLIRPPVADMDSTSETRNESIMAIERFMKVDEIHPKTTGWKSKLRVVQKYAERIAHASLTKFQKFLLQDGSGSIVDVIAFQEQVDTFGNVLKENGVYVIKGATVVPPNRYKDPRATCHYQWRLNKQTSIVEDVDGDLPQCDRKLNITNSVDFHKHAQQGSALNTMCVVLGKRQPRVVSWGQQMKTIQEFAAIDMAMEPFIVTIWEKTIPDKMVAVLNNVLEKPVVILLNFNVTEHHGESLASNSQSVVHDSSEDPAFKQLIEWKEKK